jgi:hypothetical protein
LTARSVAVLVTGAVLAPLLSSCQSTQATSAEREKDGAHLVEHKDIQIAQQSGDVEVEQTVVLPGQDTSTVAVELENNSQTGLINVPIQLDVRDAKGKTVFQNNTAGTDPTLISVPVIGPGAEVWWVHDQVFAVGGEPKAAKVEVGEANEPFPDIPDVSASDPKLVKDPISDSEEVTGEVTNNTDEELKSVYLYAVAMKGGKVVAAGRGAIDKLKPGAKKAATYNIFFTAGDPEGADISISVTPTFLKQ